MLKSHEISYAKNSRVYSKFENKNSIQYVQKIQKRIPTILQFLGNTHLGEKGTHPRKHLRGQIKEMARNSDLMITI